MQYSIQIFCQETISFIFEIEFVYNYVFCSRNKASGEVCLLYPEGLLALAMVHRQVRSIQILLACYEVRNHYSALKCMHQTWNFSSSTDTNVHCYLASFEYTLRDLIRIFL